MRKRIAIKKLFKLFVYYWLPPVLWALVIFSFSSRPTGSVSEVHWQDFAFKKFLHLVEYLVLTILNYRALTASGVNKKTALQTSFAFSVFYGLTDELHQSYTPGREPKLRDVFIDSAGASLAVIFILMILPKSPPRIKNLAGYFKII